MLEAGGMRPAGDWERDDALNERAEEGPEDVPDGTKGIEFPLEMLPMLTSPENLLCVGREFQLAVKDGVSNLVSSGFD